MKGNADRTPSLLGQPIAKNSNPPVAKLGARLRKNFAPPLPAQNIATNNRIGALPQQKSLPYEREGLEGWSNTPSPHKTLPPTIESEPFPNKKASTNVEAFLVNGA